MSKAKIDIPYSTDRLFRVIRTIKRLQPETATDRSLASSYPYKYFLTEPHYSAKDGKTSIVKDNGRLKVTFVGSQEIAEELKRYAQQFLGR